MTASSSGADNMAYFKTWEGIVEREWLDELDHVNFLTYQRIADEASIAVWKDAKGEDDSSAVLEFVMTETYVRYIRELRLGSEIEIRTLLLAFDTKRFHLMHRIESQGELCCVVETANLCFNPTERRAANFTSRIIDSFQKRVAIEHDNQPKLSIARRSG